MRNLKKGIFIAAKKFSVKTDLPKSAMQTFQSVDAINLSIIFLYAKLIKFIFMSFLFTMNESKYFEIFPFSLNL